MSNSVEPFRGVPLVASDMPLPAPFFGRLLELGMGYFGSHDARRGHQLCAAESRRVAQHLETCLRQGEHRVLTAISGLASYDLGPDELAPFGSAGRCLDNVNTPEDYTDARHPAHGAPADREG